MSLQSLNFDIWTILSCISIFILGLILISSSIPYFKQEVFAPCPNGYHKSPSGDCTEGLSTAEEPALAQQDNQTVINASDMDNSNSNF